MKIKPCLLTALTVSGLTTAALAQATAKVMCKITYINKNHGEDPDLTKICVYKKIKLVNMGFPDDIERYSYAYTFLKKQDNGSYKKN